MAMPIAEAQHELLDVPPDRRPRHIAIIMDGNGRWAIRQQKPRLLGHHAGAEAVREAVTACAKLGIEALTLYSFSIENWKRPAAEVDGLMELLVEYLGKEQRTLLDNNVRLAWLGRREGMPGSVTRFMDDAIEATSRCTGMTLALALNYGSRAEITEAVQAIARDVQAGRLQPDEINEQSISDRLYTAGLPDPDLLIRTAGERRISNYLLWQISYAEIHVTDVLWPDFRAEHLHAAIRDYSRRSRRYGGLDASNS